MYIYSSRIISPLSRNLECYQITLEMTKDSERYKTSKYEYRLKKQLSCIIVMKK